MQKNYTASTLENPGLTSTVIQFDPLLPRPAAGRTAAVMQVMEDVLLCTLRSSDVAARYSENRFVLLLEAPACEGASPMERVRAEFYRRPAHDGYLLAYSLRAAPRPGTPAQKAR